MRISTLILLLGVSLTSCDSGVGGGTSPILLRTTFDSNSGGPALNGWVYWGLLAKPTFVKDGPIGEGTWSLALESDSTYGAVAWYDFEGVDSGIYEVRVWTRVEKGPSSELPIGYVQLQAQTIYRNESCGAETRWHEVVLRDTIRPVTRNGASIHLFSGFKSIPGAKVLFNKVTVLKVQEYPSGN